MTSTSPSIIVFSSSMLEGGDSGIIGFTKIVWEVEAISEVDGGTYQSPVLSVGHL
jgi:hypothetical protein